MEKYILVLRSVLLLVAFLNISAVAAHKFNQTWEECKLAEKATDEDFKNMKNPSQPRTTVMKCMITCLGEKSGKIVNNKLNPDEVLNWFKNSPDYTDQVQESVNELLEECKNIQDPDRCEAGSKIMDCLKDGASKRGIQIRGQRSQRGQGQKRQRNEQQSS